MHSKKNFRTWSLSSKRTRTTISQRAIPRRDKTIPPSTEREKIEREITITDEKLDEIVYGLHGVTEEERKMIEGVDG